MLQIIHFETHLLYLQPFVSMSHTLDITPFCQYSGVIGNLLSKHCYYIRASFRQFVNFKNRSTTFVTHLVSFAIFSIFQKVSSLVESCPVSEVSSILVLTRKFMKQQFCRLL